MHVVCMLCILYMYVPYIHCTVYKRNTDRAHQYLVYSHMHGCKYPAWAACIREFILLFLYVLYVINCEFSMFLFISLYN